MMTSAKMIIVIGIKLAFPPVYPLSCHHYHYCGQLVNHKQWIPQLYVYHTIIFEDYHQRLPEISITRKLSGTYHQWLPKTALQHQVFEPVVESKEFVCVIEKDLCLCCRLQR